jgi:hypothetical protein
LELVVVLIPASGASGEKLDDMRNPPRRMINLLDPRRRPHVNQTVKIVVDNAMEERSMDSSREGSLRFRSISTDDRASCAPPGVTPAKPSRVGVR